MSILELINELDSLGSYTVYQRFGLDIERGVDPEAVRIDFDNWLRRCVKPTAQYDSLEAAYEDYYASF